MRRRQLYQACNHFGVAYQQGAPAVVMRDSLKANNISDQQLIAFMEGQGKLNVLHRKDETGQTHTEIYPAQEPHETARLQAEGRQIDYDKIIAERAEAQQALEKKTEVVDQQSKMLEMMAARLEALEANALPLTSMSPPQLKTIAKQRGIDVKGLRTKAELLDALEG